MIEGDTITLECTQAWGCYIWGDSRHFHFALKGNYTIKAIDGNKVTLISDSNGEQFECHKSQIGGW